MVFRVLFYMCLNTFAERTACSREDKNERRYVVYKMSYKLTNARHVTGYAFPMIYNWY